MHTLNTPVKMILSDENGRRISLTSVEHFRLCPSRAVMDRIGELTARQIDLIRLAVAGHLADGWLTRQRKTNGHRRLVVELELLDPDFWERPEINQRLKQCVDFLSGDDDWTFQPRQDTVYRHYRQRSLFAGQGSKPLVCTYSVGLDSAAGLAARLAAIDGRTVIPVTVHYQTQLKRVVRDQFDLLRAKRCARPGQVHPVQIGAYPRKVRLREVKRCKPLLFLSVAGIVAHLEASEVVEVFESGVGAVNLPLVSGSPGWSTTRSTHPKFLRLMGDLVSQVNGTEVRYHLPFIDRTKAQMAQVLEQMGLEDLALKSVSCITHPLQRGVGQRQCGHCPACVYRRQALWSAGIREPDGFYKVDVFGRHATQRELKWLMAFRQQAARLADLERQSIPLPFRHHLSSIVSSEEELTQFRNLFRQYQREWVALEDGVQLPKPATHCLGNAGGGTFQ